ncbi:MAG: CDF family Co(II)/Ni(II) efflux transporter DmeF [Candidatus Gastranaerophilaceae bacterium]|nr:CDF family Co(II)/Ni(II) efflux transporter DmeF [Candidatus Gastranaerophilaceae bacterium]
MHKHSHEVTNENEKKTLIVIIFTIIAMAAEIAYGYITNSMALLADGYHMGTHALALGLTYIAYILIRKFKDSPKFPGGTNKIGMLAAYTSSLFLGFTGIWIILEAIERLVNPLKIEFNEAILVAVIGLIVNAVCIFIMEGKHNGDCCEHSEHEHHHHDEEDYNFKAAYYHILADALTSILAIGALVVGKYLNILCFDSIVGILGGILILRWAVGLLKNTVVILIDMKKG